VGFVIRHLMISKVRGRFNTFDGEIVTAADPLQSGVTATIQLASVDTGSAQRDAHIRSADFFDVDTHPTMTYRSTAIRRDGDG
jgi:polyisoprenoid-binding protein YceI